MPTIHSLNNSIGDSLNNSIGDVVNECLSVFFSVFKQMTTVGGLDAPLTLKGCQFKLNEYANIARALDSSMKQEKQKIKATEQLAEEYNDNVAVQVLNGSMFVKQNEFPIQKNAQDKDILTVEDKEYVIEKVRVVEGEEDAIIMIFGNCEYDGVIHYNLLMKWGVYVGDVLVWQDDFEVVKVDGVEPIEISPYNTNNDAFDIVYIKERRIYRICSNVYVSASADNYLVMLECCNFVNSYDKVNKSTHWTYLISPGDEIGPDEEHKYLCGCYYVMRFIGLFDSIAGYKTEISACFGYKIRQKPDTEATCKWPTIYIIQSTFKEERIYDTKDSYVEHDGESLTTYICRSYRDPDYTWEDVDERFTPELWLSSSSEYYKDCAFKNIVNHFQVDTETHSVSNDENIYEFYIVGPGSFITAHLFLNFNVADGRYIDATTDDCMQSKTFIDNEQLMKTLKAYKWSHVEYEPSNDGALMIYDDILTENGVHQLIGLMIKTVLNINMKEATYTLDLAANPLLYTKAENDTIPTYTLSYSAKNDKLLVITSEYGVLKLNGYVWDDSENKYYIKDNQDVICISRSGYNNIMIARNNDNPRYCVYLLNYNILNEWFINIKQAYN